MSIKNDDRYPILTSLIEDLTDLRNSYVGALKESTSGEVIAARKGYDSLKDRLDDIDTQLSEKASQNEVNEKFNQVDLQLAQKASQHEVNEKFNQVNSQLADIEEDLEQRAINLYWYIFEVPNRNDPRENWDWTEAFRKALGSYEQYDYDISYQHNKNSGKIVYVPPGDYMISDTIYLRLGDTLKGAGYTSTRIWTKTAGIGCMVKVGHGLINGEEVRDTGGLVPIIEGITFSENKGGIVAIDITNVSGWKVKDCWFFADTCIKSTNSNDGFILNCVADNGCAHLAILEGTGDEYNTSQSILIDGCNIFKSRFGGIKIDGVADVTISNTFFNFINNFSLYTGSKSNYRIKVINCTFKASKTIGEYDNTQQHIVNLAPCKDFLIENCNFAFSKYCDILNYNDGIKVKNCTFFKSEMDSIANLGGEITIEDCQFSNIGGYAISATNPVKINNCKFTNILMNGLPIDNWKKGCIYLGNVSASGSQITNCECKDNDKWVVSTEGTNNVYTANNRSVGSVDTFHYGAGFNVSIGERAVNPVDPLKLIVGFNGDKRVFVGKSIPVSGDYLQGDIIVNNDAVAGEYLYLICVASGNPGVWARTGLIEV